MLCNGQMKIVISCDFWFGTELVRPRAQAGRASVAAAPDLRQVQTVIELDF